MIDVHLNCVQCSCTILESNTDDTLQPCALIPVVVLISHKSSRALGGESFSKSCLQTDTRQGCTLFHTTRFQTAMSLEAVTR